MTPDTRFGCPGCDDWRWPDRDPYDDVHDMIWHVWEEITGESYRVSSKVLGCCPFCKVVIVPRFSGWRELIEPYEQHLAECTKYKLYCVAGCHPSEVSSEELRELS